MSEHQVCASVFAVFISISGSAAPTNKFFVQIPTRFHQALNKKEHKSGGCSPDSPGEDVDATDYTLTPRTEAKYNRIDEEFQMMMQRTQPLNGAPRVFFLFLFHC